MGVYVTSRGRVGVGLGFWGLLFFGWLLVAYWLLKGMFLLCLWVCVIPFRAGRINRRRRNSWRA